MENRVYLGKNILFPAKGLSLYARELKFAEESAFFEDIRTFGLPYRKIDFVYMDSERKKTVFMHNIMPYRCLRRNL